MIFYFIILILILIVFYTNAFEHFQIVSYNNTNIPNNTITSIYDKESNILQNLFDDLNLKNKDFKESNLDNEFTLLNTNLLFPFTTTFKSMIIDYLYSNIPQYQKDNVYILGNLIKIYQKDQDTSRTFIFNFSLINPVNFFTRNIRIQIKLNNINLILDETFNYLDVIDENFIKSNTNIEYITLDKNHYINFTFTPIDNLTEPYYLIKNKYHLLDPFLTSGKESIITNNDKVNFQSVLNDKSKSKSTSRSSEYNPDLY